MDDARYISYIAPIRMEVEGIGAFHSEGYLLGVGVNITFSGPADITSSADNCGLSWLSSVVVPARDIQCTGLLQFNHYVI